MYIKRFIIRNWFSQLWRLTNPKIYRVSWQAGDPGEPMPYGSSLKVGKHWTQGKPMF